MKLGKKIAEGASAEVFEWEDDEKIIKIARPTIDKKYFQTEFANTVKMWNLGLPVPQAYEMLEYDNRPCIVFERIHGNTLRDRFFKRLLPQLASHPEKIDWNDALFSARLLANIHTLTHQELPTNQRTFLKNQIQSVNYLSKEEESAVLELLNDLPLKERICHGDANPNNILFTHEGEPILIDWLNASLGNPEADIAEFIIMIRFAILPEELPIKVIELFDSIREKIIALFMKEYTELTGITYEEVEKWIVPIAARKLASDGIVEAEKQLLVQEIKRRLELGETH
ncbi:aminoglycoside phosphotransferase family protein [Ornithinibacillus halophilus]|uniref:Predicted kinase, aminoglycoside phosphotransferase (APT) family n=1 Tax=Ornithinibacillus halophilus TaxID=930117 RepID=A0A1M5MQ37_9BACI|nr:aminoglycoside phosphotransferase family protein [Ornithinibacillus halophilus]SHG78999.1 Predicted kinase, aminoglycoside phosphotransferase (APT) family [Ornithinibacillus halophilus]